MVWVRVRVRVRVRVEVRVSVCVSSAPSVATCHPNQTSRFLRTKLAHLSSMSSFNMGSESSARCFRSTTSRMAG